MERLQYVPEQKDASFDTLALNRNLYELAENPSETDPVPVEGTPYRIVSGKFGVRTLINDMRISEVIVVSDKCKEPKRAIMYDFMDEEPDFVFEDQE